MGRIFERILAKFGRRSAWAPLPALGPAAQVGPGYLELDGYRFTLVNGVDEFMAAIGRQPRVAVTLRTLEYESILGSLIGRFDSTYASAAPENRALRGTTLLCSGCHWEFPGSYIMSLIGGFGSSYMIGGTSGFAQFGKSGKCPRCASTRSVLAYELWLPDDISQRDVDAIGRYWREQGRQWWWRSGKRQGICDRCNREIFADEGSLVSGTNLNCARCMETYLDNGLAELRSNPYFYGHAEVRKARAFERYTG